MKTEKEQLEKLLECDTYDKSEIYQWAYQARVILRKHCRDGSCISALDWLIRIGRDNCFGHFEKVKCELQELYDEKYGHSLG